MKQALGMIETKGLVALIEGSDAMLKSARNLARVDTVESTSLHPYSLMKCETLVLTEDGLKSLTERLHEKSEARSGAKAKETR